MDLRQLRYFTTLAETLNFHRAAEKLNMSQPPLTVAIRKLEQDLGIALFERDPRGVQLTSAGRAALPAARAALDQAEQVRVAARQGARGLRGRLSVGFIGSAVGELLPRIISPYRQAYPEVELVLSEMNSVDISHAIRARSLDVGLVRLPLSDEAGLAVTVIERDELVVAAQAESYPPSVKRLALTNLSDTPLIIYSQVSALNAIILLACQKAGFAPRIAQEAVQVQTILSLVQAGLGAALVPARTAQFAPSGLRLIPLSEPIAIEMGIACAHGAGPLARNFVMAALKIFDTD